MSIKYNERGEVVSVNGLTTGHFLGTPMQDALGTEEENSAYGTELATVTRNENTVEDMQPTQSSDGSGGVQVDLTQNDPEAPDYVKGRTHWVEREEITNSYDTANQEMKVNIPLFEIGDTVTLKVDNVEHSLIAFDDSGYIVIGDPYDEVDNGSGLYGWQFYVYLGDVFFYSKQRHTVSYAGEIFHKINEKFLPYIAGRDGSGLMAEAFNGVPSSQASGDYSHAEGANTTASGDYSHAEGTNTVASEQGAHAEGSHTTASGHRSHAEGEDTTASGYNAHSEGNNTTASGRASHSEGVNTTASGDYSHSEGNGTIANCMYQHVQGKYNIKDESGEYAHIVGNGELSTDRSNAHTLDWDGNAWYQGTVEGTAMIVKSPGGKRFKITVDDSGTISATEITA